MVDMNLVSLIDVFTILIFFLLSSAGGVELLSPPKSVTLPEARVEQEPRPTVVVVVGDEDIQVEGRVVATVAQALAADGDVIAPLFVALQPLAPKPDAPKAAGGKPEGATLTILGDQQVPYRLLRKVMVTSARANFADVSFAVRRKDV